jgi:hypothetical protein
MGIKGTLRVAVTALPITVGSIVKMLRGDADGAARAQQRLFRRGAAGRPGGARLAGSLVPASLSFVVVLFMVFTAWSGYLYPLRPDTIATAAHPFTPDARLAGSWGGTTLVGAWFIHASVVLAWHVVCLALLRLLARWQARLNRLGSSPLGSSAPGPSTPVTGGLPAATR